MKKFICIICVSALLSGIILVNALTPKPEAETEDYQLPAEKASLSDTEKVTESTEEIRIDPSEERRKEKVSVPDGYYYQSWIQTYLPTQQQQETIQRLLASGADEKHLISVCIFWEDTGEPFELVERLWSKRPDGISELPDPLIWIESTYDRMTTRGEEALTQEDVQKYIDEGISPSDILIANRVSRNLDYHIKDILEQKLNGAAWYDILLPATRSNSFSVNSELDTDALGGNDILDSLILARKTGDSVEEILPLAETEDGHLLDNYRFVQAEEKEGE